MSSGDYSRFRGVTKIEVLRVEINEGEGTAADPIRRVVYFCTLDGEVLASLGDDKKREFVGGSE